MDICIYSKHIHEYIHKHIDKHINISDIVHHM